MDLLDYEAEDLLMDISFQNYCLGRCAEDVRFWESWLSLHPEKTETVNRARELYFLLNGNNTDTKLAAEREIFRERFEKHLERGSLPQKPARFAPLRKLLVYSGAAAALVAAIFLLPGKSDEHTAGPENIHYNLTEVSKAGERKSFQLPDGSKVMMNAGTTIRVSKDFNKGTRELSLSGEAYFDVTPNPAQPFIIHTASMDVKVLGTAFNVKAYEGETTSETSLIHGSVEVTMLNDEKTKIRLRPNEKIIVPNAKMVAQPGMPRSGNRKKETDVKVVEMRSDKDGSVPDLSWTENRLVFADSDFDTIAGILERWYNISISFRDDEVREYRYTANFDQKTITQVLEALRLSREFKYRVAENNTIVISK